MQASNKINELSGALRVRFEQTADQDMRGATISSRGSWPGCSPIMSLECGPGAMIGGSAETPQDGSAFRRNKCDPSTVSLFFRKAQGKHRSPARKAGGDFGDLFMMTNSLVWRFGDGRVCARWIAALGGACRPFWLGRRFRVDLSRRQCQILASIRRVACCRRAENPVDSSLPR